MTVRVLEVHAAAAIPVVDHARLAPTRVRPILQAFAADPVKGSVEVLLTNKEGVVLRRDRTCRFREVQRDVVIGLNYEKVREPCWRLQAQDLCQEVCRPLLVAARHDGVIQLHAHPMIVRSPASGIATGSRHRRGRSLTPAASSSTTSAMRAARTSGRRVVASIQRRYALR